MRHDLHIASWNCERLTPYVSPKPVQLSLGSASQASRTRDLAAVFRTLGNPHVVCLQEVRLRPRDAALVTHAERAVPGYVGTFHLCDDARNAGSSGGRHYGVGTYVRDDMPAASHTPLAGDREGRVLITTFAELNLVVVNWYGVNGTDRLHYDWQENAWTGNRHAFKQRNQHAVMEACLAHANRHLIILGDVNVTPAAIDITPQLRNAPPHVEARRLMEEVFKPTLKVVDIYRHLHPEAEQYTWFNRVAAARGKLDAARVDYALVSESLISHIHGATIDDSTAAASLGSDHLPIHLTLSL